MVVVTNDWHMPRTRAIFEHVFSLPAVRGGPVPSYELEFRAAAPGIPDTRLLQLRQEKESTSLQYFLAEVAPVLGSLQEMHRWVFVQHAAYAASRLQERKEGVEGLSAVSAELLKTY